MSSQALILLGDPLRPIAHVRHFLLDSQEKLDLCLLGVVGADMAGLTGDCMRRLLVPGKGEVIHQNRVRLGLLLVSVM